MKWPGQRYLPCCNSVSCMGRCIHCRLLARSEVLLLDYPPTRHGHDCLVPLAAEMSIPAMDRSSSSLQGPTFACSLTISAMDSLILRGTQIQKPETAQSSDAEAAPLPNGHAPAAAKQGMLICPYL